MPRTTARFPSVAAADGHYESFYLKAAHPREPLALWIRYTVHKRPGTEATGSLWFTLFDARADGPQAVKQTLSGPSADEGRYIAIGQSVFTPTSVRGSAAARGRSAAWDLSFESTAEPLFHLPAGWLYRSPLPRTKLLSPHPEARFSGTARIDGRELSLDDWAGMIGHNWGSQHAERWIWLHASGLEAEGAGWLDVGIGRVRVGGRTTPWIANGVLFMEGERRRLGGIARTRVTEVRERPDGCGLVLSGRGLTVQGSVAADRKDVVGWVYADPDGSEHHTVNCSVADMTLTVSRPGRPPVTLAADRTATYELGMREHDHGVALQPFPDG